MSSALKLESLTKFYGGNPALNGVSFSVPEGSVFGLLGPNGSGKTTLLSIVLGVINATGGSYSWSDAVRKRDGGYALGGLLEKPNFLPGLTVGSQLSMLAALRGIPAGDVPGRVQEVLELTGIPDASKNKFGTLSLGMKQRAGIAAVLLSDPRVLIFDEPTNGLDPQGIIDIRNLIIRLSGTGKTIILASHMLDEIEKVCTHAAILKKGKLLRIERVGDQAAADQTILELVFDTADEDAGVKLLDSWDLCTSVKRIPGTSAVIAAVRIPDGGAAAVNRWLAGNGIYVAGLKIHKETLEDAFLKAVGEGK